MLKTRRARPKGWYALILAGLVLLSGCGSEQQTEPQGEGGHVSTPGGARDG